MTWDKKCICSIIQLLSGTENGGAAHCIFSAIRENQVGWADYSPTSSVRVNAKELPELLLAGAGANACLERLHDKPDGYVGEFQYMIDMLGKVSQLSVRVSTPALKKCPHAVSKRSGQVRGTGSQPWTEKVRWQ